MKYLEKMKVAITVLVALCLLCAVAAFFLPNAQGMVLSYLAIALATVVAIICAVSLGFLLHHRHNAA